MDFIKPFDILQKFTWQILKVKWLEFIIVVFAIVYVVAKVQFGFLTDLVDSIFGKLFMVFLIAFLSFF